MRKATKKLGMPQIGWNYMHETQRFEERLLGTTLSLPYFCHKSVLN